jgi:hypothetical protein
MMKLVDMRGLKPRPFRGPGSTPGIGIIQPSLFILYQLISNGKTVTNKLIKDKGYIIPIPGVEPGPLKGRGFKPRMSTNFII